MSVWTNGWNGVNHEKDPPPSEEEAKQYSRDYEQWYRETHTVLFNVRLKK